MRFCLQIQWILVPHNHFIINTLNTFSTSKTLKNLNTEVVKMCLDVPKCLQCYLICVENVYIRAAQSGGLGGLVRHRPILTGQKKSGRFY